MDDTEKTKMQTQREALLSQPHAKELRAFFASPAGLTAARWLRDRYVHGFPKSVDGNPTPYWSGHCDGQRELALLLCKYGGRDDILEEQPSIPAAITTNP